MNSVNKAMKKLQESRRAESAKLASLVKESKAIKAEGFAVEPENKEDLFDGRFNYKVTLSNGKVITAVCSKEKLEDAKKYFSTKTYVNTKTGEEAKVVKVEELGDTDEFEEIKKEDFGSEAKGLTDNDPAQNNAYDSDAEKGLEAAANKDAKIVAEEFGSNNKGLTDNDPAQNKPFETETKKDMADATKGKAIDNKVDESKKLDEAVTLDGEQKLEKAKELIEVIFNMDSLDETRLAAKKELRDLVFPQKDKVEEPTETEPTTEKKIVKESIFDNDEETKVKEDRLAELRTQLDVDGAQLADDEREAIENEIADLENDLYESCKPVNEEEEVAENPEEVVNEVPTEEPVEETPVHNQCPCCAGCTPVIDEIDDGTFTEAFTKFIKENYKNAKEFKLENVKINNNGKYKFECKLIFNSGKETNVTLVSDAIKNEGKSLIRFYENKVFKHLDEHKSIMTATIKVENKVLSCEKLRYNYRVALKENKVAKIQGIVK